jgi:hypothetical protein
VTHTFVKLRSTLHTLPHPTRKALRLSRSVADDPPSRAVAGPEAVAHDGQLVRGGAAREGFESPVDELDLVGGYMVDAYVGVFPRTCRTCNM